MNWFRVAKYIAFFMWTLTSFRTPFKRNLPQLSGPQNNTRIALPEIFEPPLVQKETIDSLPNKKSTMQRYVKPCNIDSDKQDGSREDAFPAPELDEQEYIPDNCDNQKPGFSVFQMLCLLLYLLLLASGVNVFILYLLGMGIIRLLNWLFKRRRTTMAQDTDSSGTEQIFSSSINKAKNFLQINTGETSQEPEDIVQSDKYITAGSKNIYIRDADSNSESDSSATTEWCEFSPTTHSGSTSESFEAFLPSVLLRTSSDCLNWSEESSINRIVEFDETTAEPDETHVEDMSSFEWSDEPFDIQEYIENYENEENLNGTL